MATIDHKKLRIELLRKTILLQIAQVEKDTNQMFHKAYPTLDVLTQQAMDSNNPARLNEAIKILDGLRMDVEIEDLLEKI